MYVCMCVVPAAPPAQQLDRQPGQETVSLEKTFTNSSLLFCALPLPPPPQFYCQCSRAFSDTAAAAARAQCFPGYSDAVARSLTRSRCLSGRMMCRCTAEVAQPTPHAARPSAVPFSASGAQPPSSSSHTNTTAVPRGFQPPLHIQPHHLFFLNHDHRAEPLT